MSEHREVGYIQLPPDSTGKKSGSVGRLIINFSGETSPTFLIGQTVTGGTNGATGEIVGVNRIGFPTGEGQLFIRNDTQTGTFIDTEDLKIGPVTYAQVANSTLETIFYQKNVLVDRQDPSRYMKIDNNGAANVTFADGQPTISTFGSLTTASVESKRQYSYSYDELPYEFYDTLTGSGSLSYLSGERAVLLDTGFTASGDGVVRQSHLHHPYQPGSTLAVLQSVVLGDTGKNDVVRRWGYFNEDDGIFWELDGTTLYTVLRSSTTGTPVETRVAQSDFNVNPLDGSIGFSLNLDTTNLYWLDLQWLGVGVVRFGIYEEDGTKTIANVIQNPNTNITTYMKTASLPIRYECFNKNTAVSNSQMKAICAAVQNYGVEKLQLKSNAVANTYPHGMTKASGELPVLTIRPAATINGLTNRAVSSIGEISVHNEHAACLKVNVRKNIFPSGSNWNSLSNSAVEWDEDATGFLVDPSGTMWSTFISSGESKHFVISNDDKQFIDDSFIVLRDDLVNQAGIGITAQVLSNDATNVTSSITWKEIHQ